MQYSRLLCCLPNHARIIVVLPIQIKNLLDRDGWTLRDATARHRGRRLEFFFTSRPTRAVTAALRRIQRADRNRFQTIGVVIAPTTAAMQRLRSCANADKFPRALFASLEELRAVAAGTIPVKSDKRGGITSFKAEILENTPVGGAQISHYRLAFKAPSLQNMQPPQFIMMDTKPARVPFGVRPVPRGQLRGAIDLTPQPLLKRPFGICRDFHPHFPIDYVKRLRLPPTLAVALYPVLPDHFDMLYKVLPHGVGTPLIAKLKRGQTVNMLGPLGRPFDVRRLRAEGVEEVHIIGGGVGMAPLILLVESLRTMASA